MASGVSIKSRLILAFVGVAAGLFFLMYLIAATWYSKNQLDQLDAFLQTESTGILTSLSAELSQEKSDLTIKSDRLRNPQFTEFLDLFLKYRVNKPLMFKTTLVIADMSDYIVGASNEALNLDMRILAVQEARMSNKRIIDNETFLFSVKNEGLNYRILQASMESDNIKVGTIRVACLLDPVLRSTADFITTSSIFFLLTVILNTLSSIFLVTLILSPVRIMSQTVREITEHKLNSRLADLPGRDELSMLAETFNHTLGRIENAYHLQEELVNDLSHQLRTPLTSMRGMVELALNQAHSAQDYRSILESNLAGIDRITALVNTMLTLAKLDSHTAQLRFQPCNLAELLLHTVDELAPLWEEKSIHFAYRFLDGQSLVANQVDIRGLPDSIPQFPDIFVIKADSFRLKQAIINILANAYRFTPSSGNIRVELCRVKIDAIDSCRITIFNDGPAIPESALMHLFDRFFQAEHSLPAADSDGSPPPTFGLGLSISQRVVEMHQGHIRAYNPPAGGAAFEVTLPIQMV